ncbi:c-type cytochrome [Baekduia soli]|uniref:C-type cytochrome n=1 Tax=Baekduia soli TaxID=496014 RepID=A0A5B8U5C4_9ACTN|nr:c-type cytochrome [Baekduia soli]QEC48220.1 c-type cytochrome [Baekduia soli]
MSAARQHHRLRPRALIGGVLAVVLALGAAPAGAQPPVGIVRPDPAQERTMSPAQLGAQLFAGNCASCHGDRGQGVLPGTQPNGVGDVKAAGPSLRGVGALAVDFYLRTGYMPLGRPGAQPERSRVLLRDNEIRALITYVGSLGKGPPVPRVDVQAGNLGEGRELFTEHCAGCHQVVAQGGVVTGARVPPLEKATPQQVAEAIRIGPYLMPHFDKRQISDAQVQSIARYVQWTHSPDDAGGWGLGNLGPFSEGIVTWLVAIVVLIATCIVIAWRRT